MMPDFLKLIIFPDTEASVAHFYRFSVSSFFSLQRAVRLQFSGLFFAFFQHVMEVIYVITSFRSQIIMMVMKKNHAALRLTYILIITFQYFG